MTSPFQTPYEVVEAMKRNGQTRAYFVWDRETKTIKVSHPMWNEIARLLLNNKRDFHEHEGVFLEIGRRSGALIGVFLHRTVRGSGSGGVRNWDYKTFYDYIIDGLRLAEGMGRKNALAGLWWGGGKAVIARNRRMLTDGEHRKIVYQEYGELLSSLQGCFVSAEDLGTTPEDMEQVALTTRFTTCIPARMGGSGNPSVLTGLGVVCAMEGAVDHLGMGTLAGKSVAVQGLGNVASSVINNLLVRKVGRVVAYDVNPRAVEAARKRYPSNVTVHLIKPGNLEIFKENVDIISPCALGGIINPKTIALLHPNLKIVCGSANNQLLDEVTDGVALEKHGVTYVPDFLANRMGIVNCSNEQYGLMYKDPAIHRHFGRSWENSIFLMAKAVLTRASRQGVTASKAANDLADELAARPHPIWGRRQHTIIASILKFGWEKGQGTVPPLGPSITSKL